MIRVSRVPRQRNRDGLSLVLVLALVMLAGVSFATADWVDYLILVPAVGVLGVLAGSGLAWSRFGPRLSILLAAAYGAFVVTWQLGQSLDPALSWRQRLADLGGRLTAFVQVLLHGDPNPDPLMFVVLMAVLFWILGAQAGWAIFRRQALWRAVLPPGLALLINAFFYVGSAALEWYVASFVLLTLLLALRLNLVQQRDGWSDKWAQVPPGADQAISRAGLLLAVALVVLAWGGPAFAQSQTATDLWIKVSSPLRSLRDRIGEVFGELRSPLVTVSDAYSARLALGAGVEPGDALIMEVTPRGRPGPGARFYWRSRVYDHYEAGAWSMTVGEPSPFDPGHGSIAVPPYAARDVLAFEFVPRVPALQALYVPSAPVWVSRTAVVTQELLPEGGADVLVLSSAAVVVEGETYEARGAVASPTAEQLRRAGSQYPQWAVDTYLQSPESISPRVVQLAEAIAAGWDTPYDKAAAVTAWLRDNLAYSRITDPPPADQEPVEWLLFEYKIGFCNYFATAEVVLLRSLGIPARMVAGYASGRLDEDSGVYEVRAGDAHAWVEVFFPGYGWIEFEPTPEQPALVRPETAPEEGVTPGGVSLGEVGPGALPEERFNQEFSPGLEPEDSAGTADGLPSPARGRATTWIAAGLIGLLGIVGLWALLDPYFQAILTSFVATRLRRNGSAPPRLRLAVRLASATPAAQAYVRWNLWLARLRFRLAPAMTPFERAEAFGQTMPEGREAAWTIVEAYSAERFGGRLVDPAAVRAAWRGLYPRFWLAWAGRWLVRLRDPRHAGPPARDSRPRRSA